jgi:hypothetical protein
MIESWLELRHALERVTNADRMRDQQIRPLLKNPPEITYMIATPRPHRSWRAQANRRPTGAAPQPFKPSIQCQGGPSVTRPSPRPVTLPGLSQRLRRTERRFVTPLKTSCSSGQPQDHNHVVAFRLVCGVIVSRRNRDKLFSFNRVGDESAIDRAGAEAQSTKQRPRLGVDCE